jgi:superfamily II DNA or RNA helicase
MIELREYQQKGVEALREKMLAGEKRIVFCAPTGSGKTVVFSHMCKKAVKKGNKVLILTDRVELLTSTHGTLSRFDLDPVKIEAGKQIVDFDQSLYVGMVETVTRRLKKHDEYKDLFRSLNLVIIDEAHKQAFNKLFKYFGKRTVVIGFTATPYRKSPQKAMSEQYNTIVELTTIPELVDAGFLASPASYGYKVDLKGVKTKRGEFDAKGLHQAYERQKVYQGVVANYLEYSKGLKTIVFSASIDDSLQVHNEFVLNGVDARHLDSTMSKSAREEILDWFAKTPDAVICNVGILTTGFDCPDIKTVILYRATRSLPLFLQMCGRGSRVTADKKEFTILDFGGNLNRHGLWEQDRTWSLELEQKSSKKNTQSAVKECPKCKRFIASSYQKCPCIIGFEGSEPKICGFEFPKVERNSEKLEAVKLTKVQAKENNDRARKAVEEKDVDTLVEMIKSKEVKPYFVFYQLDDFQTADKIREGIGYKRGFWHYNLKRFPRLK